MVTWGVPRGISGELQVADKNQDVSSHEFLSTCTSAIPGPPTSASLGSGQGLFKMQSFSPHSRPTDAGTEDGAWEQAFHWIIMLSKD
jgi:hypothetical protein